MAASLSKSAIWGEIERSENYLVCCMFEEALSLASSSLRHICDSDACIDEIQLHDIMESAGMVIVQSLKKLGRTPEILDELRVLFGSVTAIPIQVILIGACFQISESSFSGLQEFLMEFLGKWRYMDGQAGPFGAHYERCDGRSVLGVDRYLKVVELYTITLLGMVLNETDVAISWLEKAELPEAKRQELLRILHSYSLTVTKSSQAGDSPLLAEVNEAHAAFGKERTMSEVDVSLRSSKSPNGIIKKQGQAILKLSERIHPCFWWFRTVNLKFGNARLVLTRGKIVLWGSFIIFIYYVLQKKRDTLKLIVRRQASSVKKALGDIWHLAFSVQVNPLAAVQPLPAAIQRSRYNMRSMASRHTLMQFLVMNGDLKCGRLTNFNDFIEDYCPIGYMNVPQKRAIAIRWNDTSDVLDLTFSMDADEEKLILYERAEVTDYELIPGGRNIRVTEENKHEYVGLVAEHRLTTAIRPQINAFLDGFNELIPRDLISTFNDKELELLISGLPDIDCEFPKSI